MHRLGRAVAALILLLATPVLHAQCVSLTSLGSSYSQTFDSLSNTAGSTTNNLALTGWFMTEGGGGARDNEQYAVDTGGSTTGDTYSYGAAAATDRALGELRSGTLIPNFGACFTNNTGATITSLDLDFYGEQWRLGTTGRTDQLSFEYATDATSLTTGNWISHAALNFVTPDTATAGAKNGNAIGTRTQRVSAIGSLSIANGGTFWIRWGDLDATGADDGLAIDDFNLTPQGAVPLPTLSVDSVSQNETNSGTTTFRFTVSLTSPAPAGGVTFDIATDDDTTNATTDYVWQSLTGQSIPAGSSSYTFDVDVRGDTVVEPDERFFVNVTNITGATAGTTQGIGTILNDDTRTLNIDSVTHDEGSAGTTTYTFTVSLSHVAPAGGVTFDITTTDDTATGGSDFVAKSLTTQTIPAGSSSYSFDVLVNGDSDVEPTETFFVDVSNITGAVGGTVRGTGTITTDEPTLSIADVAQAETNSATTTFSFTVQLDLPAPAGGVTFDIATSALTATAGTDYVERTLTSQTIPAGSTSYTFDVTVNGDAVYETNETFRVDVTNVSAGIGVTDGQATGTITNDDAAPAFTIADVAMTEGDSGTQTMTFTIALSGAREGSIDVDVATADGSAISGSDYLSGSSTLTFAPGDATQTFDVTINGDTDSEGDEQFFVNLSNVTGGATISDAQALGIIRLDDAFSIAAEDTAYVEDFDALAQTAASTTPTGWTRAESGTNANNTYGAGTGSSTGGDTYSLGVAGTNAITDRALGTLFSSSLTPAIGAFYRNDTGATITSLSIQYFGEEWRLGNAGRADRLDFQYSLDATSLTTGAWTDVDTLDFSTPNQAGTGAKDGNAAANRTKIVHTIAGLSIAPGETFWIRFNDFNASGSDDALAIDDFSITANFAGAFLSIDDVQHFEGDALTTAYKFTLTLTQPAPAGGVSFDLTTQDGTATSADGDYNPVSITAAFAPGQTSMSVTFFVNGDTAAEPTEQFFATLSNITGALPADTQGVGTIVDDDSPITLIHDIQGNGATSPIDGSSVTFRGIVTGVKTSGFFVQEEDADADADPATSEGVFVFTSSSPAANIVLGAEVLVSGTVSEYVPTADAQQPPMTEIGFATTVVLSTGNPLPAAVPLTASFPDPAGQYDQLERVEAMRVSVASLTVVGPTDGSFNEVTGSVSSNGRFFGVVTGVPRPFREPGIQAPDVPSSGSIPPIPRWDFNPERLKVESNGLGAGVLVVKSGDVVTGITGPLDYAFRAYAILQDGTSTAAVTPGTLATTTSAPTAGEVTVSSFNLNRFFNDVAEGTGPTVDSTLYQARLDKASLAIRENLNTPDIIGVQEVENLATLQDLAARISSDALAASQPDPAYVAYLVEGNDIGGIDVGFLVKTGEVAAGLSRVTGITVTQELDGTTWIDPKTNTEKTLNDRPSLVLTATVNHATGATYPITVINNHLRSLLGMESDAPDGLTTEGYRVRQKRLAQAQDLANLVQQYQTADPTRNIVLVGDFNAFEVNDGYVDVIGTIAGTPVPDDQTVVVGDGIDLVHPDLQDLVDTPPPAERYSYSHEGNAQNIDHAIVNQPLMTSTVAWRIEHPRINTDYPETNRAVATNPLRISDHDPLVAYFAPAVFVPSLISVSGDSVTEGDSGTTPLTFTVTLDKPAATTVTVDYATTNGTAIDGSDFTGASGTLTFAAGETSKTFTVDATGELTYEGDETFMVLLSNATGNAVILTGNANGTIVNDDVKAQLSLSGTAVMEGSAYMPFMLTLNKVAAEDVTVDYATSDGTATAGSDYTASNATATIVAGTLSTSIDVPLFDDAIPEPSETLTVTLSSPSPTVTIASGTATGTIANDETTRISIGDAGVSEGDSGTTALTFDVTLDRPIDTTITVDYATADINATAGSDYAAATGTVTFAPNETAKTITVLLNGDPSLETNEAFYVVLSSPTPSEYATILDDRAVGTITNDDTAATISISDAEVAEGNAGGTDLTFTVTLSVPPANYVWVNYATSDGTATQGTDYVGATGTVTFDPGATTQTFTVTVTGDTLFEPDETVLVTLSEPSDLATIADGEATGTITNDDSTATITVSDVSSAEGDAGTTTTSVNVMLDRVVLEPVSVQYATSNGTATAGSDYVAASGTVTFAAGETEKSIALTLNGDTLPETNETFAVDLTSPSANATIGDATGIVTLLNDDKAVMSVGDASVIEGNAGPAALEFPVTLATPSPETVTVNYATFPGTAAAVEDYAEATGTLTFAPGETAKMIVVTVNGDTDVEPDESLVMQLYFVSLNATLADPIAEGTIVNDDAVSLISIADASVTEGDSGTTTMTFDVTLNAPATSPLTVNYATSNSGAVAGTDYVAASGTLTFAAGESSKSIDVTVNSDIVFEADETFFLNLGAVTGNATVADGMAIGTILNDDVSSMIVADEPAVLEGDSGTTTLTFHVTLDQPNTATVTVDYVTADLTATAGTDYVATSGTLTFAPGETEKTVAVTVNGDTDVEPEEYFSLNLSNPSPNAGLNGAGTGTITNDDAVSLIRITDSSLLEGDAGTSSMSFTVTLDAAAATAVTVDFATVDDTATDASDYVATTGTLTFAPGETTKTIDVGVNGDFDVEPDETMSVQLSNWSSNATAATAVAVGTIVNDDATTLVSIGDASALEGDAGTTAMSFTVTLDAAAATAVTVDFATVGDTATAGSDYVTTSGTLTFAPGETTKTIDVDVNGDFDVEPDETFHVALSNASANAIIAVGTGNGVVQNDDAVAALSMAMTIAPASPVAGETITKTIVVTNAGPGAATNVVVTDDLQSGLTLVSASTTRGTCNAADPVVCQIGTLAAGDNATITIEVQAASPGSFSNSATVTSDQDIAGTTETETFVVAAAATTAQIPTLSEYALLALLALLAAIAVQKLS